MSVLKVKNGNQWDIVPAIKGDTGDPAADESITDAMLVPDGIKTEIDWLWGNQLMDSREGDILHAEDAYTAPAVDISVDGKSTQVMTTGKNLLSDTTDTWANYTIVQGLYKYVEIDVPPSTKLTVSPTSTAAISGIRDFNGYVVFWIDTTVFLNANIIYPINASVPRTMTFTSGANGKLRIGLVNTMTQEALNALWKKVKLQLEVGSSATAYEPYTGGKPSPSPDYPQEIVSVDEPELTFAGKNLFDPSHLLDASGWTVSDGVYTGFARNLREVYNESNPYPVGALSKEPKAYTFSLDYSSADSTKTFYVTFMYADGSTSRYRNILGESGHYSFTTEDGKTLAGVSFIYSSAQVVSLSNIQLELGSTATAYEPYTGTVTSLLPDGYSLRSLPDGTHDTLALTYLRPSTREGWAWYSRVVERVINIATASTFTSYDGRTRHGSNPGCVFGIAIDAPAVNVLGYCSHGVWVEGTTATENYGQFGRAWVTHNDPNLLKLTIAPDRSSLALGNEWLAENGPITFVYKLATPVTTKLDPIELPIMPSKDATIWSDPSAQLKVTYIQDTNLVIQSLEATVADMATS